EKVGWDDLLALTSAAVRNTALSGTDEELEAASRHWQAFVREQGQERALQALSLGERLGRWVQTFADEMHRRLQPKAEQLGKAFGVEGWVVPLFSEEIIRGSSVFALSRMLHRLTAVARKEAGVGRWQFVSSAPAQGRVRVTPSLLAVQAERYGEPTVLIAREVSGEEEIPEGVTAVLTLSQPDLVSHVAVRARNAGVLFASGVEAEACAERGGREGKCVSLEAAGGEVEYREGSPQANGRHQPKTTPPGEPFRPQPLSKWVLTAEEFAPGVVGGKSNNLNA